MARNSSLAAASASLPRQILVAVDFGTTYSGVACAQNTRVSLQITFSDTYNADLVTA